MENNDSPLTEMTPEMARARAEAWLHEHPYGEQDENGIDLSSIRQNLQLTYSERLERLERAARNFLEMRQTMRHVDS